MKAKDLIKILEMVDGDTEVMVNSLDWSHRDSECCVSSVSISNNDCGKMCCTLSYEKFVAPEQGDCDRDE